MACGPPLAHGSTKHKDELPRASWNPYDFFKVSLFGNSVSSFLSFFLLILLLPLLLLSHFSRVRPHRRQPTRLPHPWDSPGKNTGVGCHFLLQCRKVKSEREVAQSRPTLSEPMDCSLPGSSVHGIFQARVLEWGAIAWGMENVSS